MNEATFAALGERLTKALLTGDFDQYRQLMDLPIKIEPRGGVAYTLTNVDALNADFNLYHMATKTRRITDIYRKVTDIEEAGNGRFDVTCQMHILAVAERVVDPFESIMTLHEAGGEWRFCHIRSPLRHIQWTLGEADL